MQFTGLIYPAPSPPSYNTDKLIGELLYLPKDFSENRQQYVDRYATFSKMGSHMRRATAAEGTNDD